MPFMLCRLTPIASVPSLTNSVGSHADTMIAQDLSNGDIYLKRSSGWVKTSDVSGAEQSLPVTGAIAVKNSAGSVTRNLTATAGVVNLAATDAIVANNDSVVLKKSDGVTTSAGNATLNSPATAVVAAGVVSNVKASA